MISSAVVVPSNEARNVQPSSLKRKVSQSIHDDAKRPRGDSHDTLSYDDTPQSPEGTRRASLVRPNPNSAEEKKRNQRLFGGILGVVSQRTASTTAAHKRRDEIEARTRERARREVEELDAQRQKRKAELLESRRARQVQWDEKARSVRHANMRATACYLKTRTEPVLYYKPWDLRPEDEALIAKHKSEVEEQIAAELLVDNQTRDENQASKSHETIPASQQPRNESKVPYQDSGSENPGTASVTLVDERPGAITNSQSDHAMDEDDQADGELVKGLEEDDVIY